MRPAAAPPAAGARTSESPAGIASTRRPRSFPAAVACALRGLRFATRRQPNLRAHIAIAGLVLLAGAAAGLTAVELALLAAAGGLVLSAELLNTSIELVTDLVCPTEDPRAAAVKDVSAGAVLAVSGAAAALALFILLGHVSPGGSAAGRAAAALGVACLAAAVMAARRRAAGG
ncbi:MAG TPA: diacylglycerol kinase [bacterium]|nr:diacylglycerol kinase [bacterium]